MCLKWYGLHVAFIGGGLGGGGYCELTSYCHSHTSVCDASASPLDPSWCKGVFFFQPTQKWLKRKSVCLVCYANMFPFRFQYLQRRKLTSKHLLPLTLGTFSHTKCEILCQSFHLRCDMALSIETKIVSNSKTDILALFLSPGLLKVLILSLSLFDLFFSSISLLLNVVQPKVRGLAGTRFWWMMWFKVVFFSVSRKDKKMKWDVVQELYSVLSAAVSTSL